MKILVAALAVIFVGSPASAQSVDVGNANWSKLPAVTAKPSRIDTAQLATAVETILSTKQCTLRDQSSRHFDISVPYAVQFDPQGKVSRILVGSMDCTPLEQLVGYVVLARSDAGDYTAGNAGPDRWYASAVNINLR